VNKYGKIFVIAMAASIPPWGMFMKPLGFASQVSGIAVQLVGLAVLIWLTWSKKSFW